MRAPLVPPHTLAGFSGAPDTLRAMVHAVQGPRGESSMLVRGVTEQIVRNIHPKDYLGEILAIRNWVAENVRYSNDPLHVEVVKDPQRLIEEYLDHGRAVGDCFPEGTQVLNENYRLMPIEELQIGMRIWGLDRWSTVEATAYKGRLSVDAVRMNNGSTLMLTPEHHVYVLDCPQHELPDPESDAKPCSCSEKERVERRITVSELQPNMVLTASERIPFGHESLDPDRAYVEGLYISDGWSDQNSRFCISGQDGCPKEEQKRKVEEICRQAGIATRWNRKYIAVNDSEWTLRMQRMGGHAPEKHVLSLDLDEGAAAAMLRGIMADSSQNTSGNGRTLTTTSRTLAVQTRILHKMFGISCGWSYIENHGGLGKNPIYRIGTRGTGARRAPLLRVRKIDREVCELPCWDIQTDDHRVYLPEHDVTVSQCDDMASLIACMALQCGRVCEFVVVGFSGAEGDYSHVFVRVLEPKSGQWIVCDPVAGTDERGMLSRVTNYETWSLDEAA